MRPCSSELLTKQHLLLKGLPHETQILMFGCIEY